MGGADPAELQLEVEETAGQVMRSVGHANYVWDIPSDGLAWSENFASLIGFNPGVYFTSGRNFEKLLSMESPQTRFGTVLSGADENRDPPGENGYPYQCVYAIAGQNTRGESDIWIEDTGRWFPNDKGKPVKAIGLIRIINERRKREETLRRQTDFDDLTDLPNRRVLQTHMERASENAFNEGKSCAFMLLSIERLELVNATYGYETGDEILRMVAERIGGQLRNGDMVARFSGAKFGILLQNCNGSEVYIAAKRYLQRVEADLFRTSKGPVAVKGVVGACLMPKHATQVSEALSAVSIALAEAKRDASLPVCLFDPDPQRNETYRRQASLATNIVSALDRPGGMVLAYQPVVDASAHEVAFHEALLRMNDETGKTTDAADFIGVAEKLGLIRHLDHRSLELAIETLKQSPDAKLSLNVSHETAEDPAWISKLAKGLHEAGGYKDRLIIEVTESHAARDLDETRKFIDMVREIGCRVAIDDFGAGFTSFANLQHMTVDIIKIDGQFCRDLANNTRNQVFIKSLLSLAHAFDVETVVEWVEDVETAATLTQWGVTYLQGQVFGMPLKASPWPMKEAVEVSKKEIA